jgi:large subunit ribosomal protein L15
MKVHELQLTAAKTAKRIGRGIGSGKGKTAGRGTKGQNSRSGGGVRPGFEGGQNPLAKRLPKKRGFVPVARIEYTAVSLGRLDALKGTKVTSAVLVEQGVIKNLYTPVKVLGTGTLSKKLDVELQLATKTAIAAITKAGGTFTAAPLVKRPKRPSKRNRAVATTN